MYTPSLTCTRLHSHVHACHSHMYTPAALTCTRLHSHVHACHSHMHTPLVTCTCLYSHVHVYTHMYTPATLTCTRLHSHVHACTHMYTPTHTCTRLPLSHVHVYTHMYTPAALTCTRLHSHVHACTHMYTPAAQAPAAATCCPGVWVSHWPRPSGLRSCCRSRQVFSLQHVSSHICYLLSWGVGKPLATAIWPQKLLSFQASVLTTARFVPHLLLAVLGCG